MLHSVLLSDASFEVEEKKYWLFILTSKLSYLSVRKNYFGFTNSTGTNFELRVIHRTEISYAVATISLGEWEDNYEADLGDLATQPIPFMIAPLKIVAELGMNLDKHQLTLKIKGQPYD